MGKDSSSFPGLPCGLGDGNSSPSSWEDGWAATGAGQEGGGLLNPGLSQAWGCPYENTPVEQVTLNKF